MKEMVLQGPFLTRAQAARAAGVPSELLIHRPDLLKLGSPFLQEVYFAFQFDDDGVRPELGRLVHLLKVEATDLEIADWLARPDPGLNASTPLHYLDIGGTVEGAVTAWRVGRDSAAIETESSAKPAAQDAPNVKAPHRRPVFRARQSGVAAAH